MRETTDELAAAGNKLAGNAKEAVGKATDNEKLIAEGKGQQVNGTLQDVKGSVKATRYYRCATFVRAASEHRGGPCRMLYTSRAARK